MRVDAFEKHADGVAELHHRRAAGKGRKGPALAVRAGRGRRADLDEVLQHGTRHRLPGELRQERREAISRTSSPASKAPQGIQSVRQAKV